MVPPDIPGVVLARLPHISVLLTAKRRSDMQLRLRSLMLHSTLGYGQARRFHRLLHEDG